VVGDDLTGWSPPGGTSVEQASLVLHGVGRGLLLGLGTAPGARA